MTWVLNKTYMTNTPKSYRLALLASLLWAISLCVVSPTASADVVQIKYPTKRKIDLIRLSRVKLKVNLEQVIEPDKLLNSDLQLGIVASASKNSCNAITSSATPLPSATCADVWDGKATSLQGHVTDLLWDGEGVRTYDLEKQFKRARKKKPKKLYISAEIDQEDQGQVIRSYSAVKSYLVRK